MLFLIFQGQCFAVAPRLVALPSDKKHALDLNTFFTAFVEVYRRMLQGESLICAHSGKITRILHPPNAIILDVRTSMFAGSVFLLLNFSYLRFAI